MSPLERYVQEELMRKAFPGHKPITPVIQPRLSHATVIYWPLCVLKALSHTIIVWLRKDAGLHQHFLNRADP